MSSNNLKMGFYINMTACIGCRTCQIACKDKNDLPVGILYRRVRSFETGKYPNPGYYHYTESCHHCDKPQCVKICPTGAMRIAEDGTVQQKKSICIQCKYCITSCPYGIPQYNEKEHTISKCDSCKDLRDRGLNPACVNACVMRCIEWGVLEELKQRHSGEDLTSYLPIFGKQPVSIPALLIKPKKAALNPVYTELEV